MKAASGASSLKYCFATRQPMVRNYFFIYLVKFIGIFCLAYFGTLAVIGLSAPGGYYSNFIDRYFDYISWIRYSLLYASEYVLSVFGFETDVTSQYLLKLSNGYGVRLVYSCIGYGVMSFWIAFIAANKGGLKKKLLWILAGIFLILVINICRICLLLLATNGILPSLPGFDHHTWFNIASYILLFALMYVFDRSSGKPLLLSRREAATISANKC